jgi:lysophospholipase L1-like esterase
VEKEVTAPGTQERWFYRYPKLTLSAVALCGCIVATLFAELTARVLFPEWAPTNEERVKFWTYDDLLGWAHTPNQRGRFTHRDFSVDVATNSQGMRDSEYSMERTGKRRVLVLGDSFGWGFGVEHHERFSEILENAHPDWEIINASVSGYGTDQEFLFLKQRGAAFKPDVVLLLFHVSDFENNIRADIYWHFKPFFVIEHGKLKLENVPVPKTTIRQRIQRFLLGRTYLGTGLYRGMNSLFQRSNNPIVSDRTDKRDRDSEDKQRIYDVTHYLITGMNELSKKNGAIFVLVSIPMDGEKRTFLQKIAATEKIPYLPLDAYFESTVARVTFPHDGHWNAKGHEIAANAIDAFLWKSGVFDTSKSER